jgi:ATP-dependent Clp protease, protease subunit
MHQWYKIQNKTEKAAEILIYEQIGKSWWDDSGVSAKEFVTDLAKLNVETIDLHINSPGGSVFEGNSIYNALKAHKAKVHVKIDGIAASIASVIAMAGDTVEMPENAMMMIHDPWSFSMGNASDMRKEADALDKIKVGLVAAYRNKSGQTDDEIGKLMTDETWMTAKEAVDLGFCDKMTEPVKAQANFNMLAQFRNVPAQLKAGMTGKEDGDDMGEQTPKKSPDITLDLIKNEYPAIVETLLAQGRSEGAETERKRIQAVHAQAYPGFETIVNAAMFDGTSDGGTVAMQVLAAQKEQLSLQKKNLREDAPKPVDEPTGEKSPVDENLPVDQKAKLKWDQSPEIRAEFLDKFDSYLAFEQASASGRVKVLKNGGEK